MTGAETVIIQALIGAGTVGSTVAVISRWTGKIDQRLASVESMAENAMTRSECKLIDVDRHTHFDSLAERIEDLEGEDKVLPREVQAMQQAYKDALQTLTGNIDNRFSRLELQLTQLTSDLARHNGKREA